MERAFSTTDLFNSDDGEVLVWTQILIGKVIFLGYYFSLFFIRVKLFQAAQMEYAF